MEVSTKGSCHKLQQFACLNKPLFELLTKLPYKHLTYVVQCSILPSLQGTWIYVGEAFKN